MKAIRPSIARLLLLSLGLLAIGSSFACTSKLETGYSPTRLGASSSVRRGYYASPYSAEATAGAQDRDTENNARRPNVGN